MAPFGIEERRGVWEATSGPARIRGASRVSRDAPSVGGVEGPANSRRVTGFPGRAERRGVWGAGEFDARHRLPGTRRASGGFGGPANSMRVTALPGRAERRRALGADVVA